jgi:multidrug transporter EmrE-like cation transporter
MIIDKLLNINTLIILGGVLLEIFAMSLYKYTKNTWLFVILYGLIGFSMSKMINLKGIGIGNALFDILGIALVTIAGFFLFNEKITLYNLLGMILAMISIYLLT